MTQDEVAEHLGCSRKLVAYIERQALAKMRKRLIALGITSAIRDREPWEWRGDVAIEWPETEEA